jgi:hypothetical protein
LDSSNRLFATALSATTVYVFPQDSTKPTRSLNVQIGGAHPAIVESLQVDAKGFLYVGYLAIFTTPHHGSIYDWGVLVYAPGAGGNVAPVQQILIGYRNSPGHVFGLALDAQGNLLASSVAANGGVDAVWTYGSPTTNPRLLRTLGGSGVSLPFGLAIDASDELFVVNGTPGSAGPGFIAAFPATATGNPSPDRQITIAGARTIGYGMTTASGVLFATDPAAGAVYEVDATTGGLQTPIATLSVSSPSDVKLGP